MRNDENEAEAQQAETRSVPGDLSKLPPAWHHKMIVPDRPGTSIGNSSSEHG
jgi:hypothetical protein